VSPNPLAATGDRLFRDDFLLLLLFLQEINSGSPLLSRRNPRFPTFDRAKKQRDDSSYGRLRGVLAKTPGIDSRAPGRAQNALRSCNLNKLWLK
jgi:hypothetical protein